LQIHEQFPSSLGKNIYEKFPPIWGNHFCISKTTWKLFMGFGTVYTLSNNGSVYTLRLVPFMQRESILYGTDTVHVTSCLADFFYALSTSASLEYAISSATHIPAFSTYRVKIRHKWRNTCSVCHIKDTLTLFERNKT
jgi:hypothetical protein